jgi:hypothetical protein
MMIFFLPFAGFFVACAIIIIVLKILFTYSAYFLKVMIKLIECSPRLLNKLTNKFEKSTHKLEEHNRLNNEKTARKLENYKHAKGEFNDKCKEFKHWCKR